MNHSPFAFAHACFALIGVPGSFERAAKSDWARSLRLERGVSSLSPERLVQKQNEARETTEKRMKILRKRTFISLAWVISALVSALIFVVALKAGELRFELQHAYAIASIFSLSWGTLGRLGWQHGSFSGATLYEELDAIIFWLLYWLGTMFGIAAVFGSSA